MTPTPDTKDYYTKVRKNHKVIMAAIMTKGFKEFDELRIPLLKSVKVKSRPFLMRDLRVSSRMNSTVW